MSPHRAGHASPLRSPYRSPHKPGHVFFATETESKAKASADAPFNAVQMEEYLKSGQDGLLSPARPAVGLSGIVDAFTPAQLDRIKQVFMHAGGLMNGALTEDGARSALARLGYSGAEALTSVRAVRAVRVDTSIANAGLRHGARCAGSRLDSLKLPARATACLTPLRLG